MKSAVLRNKNRKTASTEFMCIREVPICATRLTQERKNLVATRADEETTMQMLRKETDAAA